MSNLVLIPLIALAAATVQSITGFGAGILMMIFLPNIVPMYVAPAVSGTIGTPLSFSIALRYRRHINLKKMLWPVLFYLVGTTIAIRTSTVINMDALKPVFGLLLIVLAVYFMFFSANIKLKADLPTALVCGFFSGLMGGFFGIGGPLLVLYYLAVTDSKEEYLGTINGTFACTDIYQLIVRILSGILTIDLLPTILCGVVGMLVGRAVGSKVADRLNGEQMKKYIYLFMAFAGVVTVVNSL